MAKRKLLLTLEETQKRMADAGIEIEDGKLYNLYDCGHILLNDDDECKTMYRTETRLANRTCPICVHFKPLLVKYKRCGCGVEHIGYNQPQSVCCNECPNSRKKEMKKLFPGGRHNNKKMADPLRWDCIKRDACLIHYSKKHQGIPCKNCDNYKKDPVWCVE